VSFEHGQHDITRFNYSQGLALTSLGNGCGITTSLISLIANAGQADQAIATAGLSLENIVKLLVTHTLVSYLFRSMGSVIGLSISGTLVQSTLRSVLYRTLHGKNVERVCCPEWNIYDLNRAKIPRLFTGSESLLIILLNWILKPNLS